MGRLQNYRIHIRGILLFRIPRFLVPPISILYEAHYYNSAFNYISPTLYSSHLNDSQQEVFDADPMSLITMSTLRYRKERSKR